jgi:hypothetical protein
LGVNTLTRSESKSLYRVGIGLRKCDITAMHLGKWGLSRKGLQARFSK